MNALWTRRDDCGLPPCRLDTPTVRPFATTTASKPAVLPRKMPGASLCCDARRHCTPTKASGFLKFKSNSFCPLNHASSHQPTRPTSKATTQGLAPPSRAFHKEGPRPFLFIPPSAAAALEEKPHTTPRPKPAETQPWCAPSSLLSPLLPPRPPRL